MRSGIVAVMFGLVLSACSNAKPTACTAPRGHWRRPVPSPGLHMIWNRVSLTHDGTVYWNGSRVSKAELIHLLRNSHHLNPEPDVLLEAEMGVPCETLEGIRDQMEESLGCHSGEGRCVEGYPNFMPLPTNGG